MRYWKGLLIALTFDASYLGTAALVGPDPAPRTYPPAQLFTASAVAEGSPSIAELEEIGAQEDSLFGAIQADSGDVGAMAALARLYLDLGWAGRAIGPLARALEIEPGDAELERALAEAIERSGEDLTDGDLAVAAREFMEIVAMWGHNC